MTINLTSTTSLVPVIAAADMRSVGYFTRPGDEAALLHCTNPDVTHRTLLLRGQPGVGKSEFAKALARAIDATGTDCLYIETLLHSWSDDGQLFKQPDVGNVAAVAAGLLDPQFATVKGVLWRAAEASTSSVVVLLLDEIDKTQQRTEALLLQFLQDGRVEGSDHMNGGRSIYAQLANVITVMTTNEMRELADATRRRAFRYTMEFLPEQQEIAMLRKWTSAPTGAIAAVVAAANQIRTQAASTCSAQEMKYLLLNARRADSPDTIVTLIQGTIMQYPQDLTPQVVSELATTLFNAFAVEQAGK